MGYIEDYAKGIQDECERRIAKEVNDILIQTLISSQQDDGPKTVFLPEFDEKDDIVLNFGSNSDSGSSNDSKCVGSYTVSGYTRADGTEVSDYVRSCGAAHLGNSDNSKNDDKNSENEDSSENRDNDEEYNNNDDSNDNYVFDLYASKTDFDDIEADSSSKNTKAQGISGSVKNTYEKIKEKILRKTTQSEFGNEGLPLKDYYKIALDLSDKSKAVKTNNRNKVYKAKNLPKDVNQKVVLEKVARGLGLDLNNPIGLEKAKDTTVVVPTVDSKLVEVIQRSEKIKDFIKTEYPNIVNGKYEGKFYDNGITFELPNKSDSLPDIFDKSTLFGTIHNTDIYDLKTNSDGSVSFVVSDFYDFEYMKGKEYNIIKKVNNNAYRQQQSGKLTPYALYIPVVISAEQFMHSRSNRNTLASIIVESIQEGVVKNERQ